MMNLNDIPKYKCHKVVHALKITGFRNFDDAIDLHFKNHNTIRIHDPDAGRFHINADLGYLVIYADGYQSWSPTEAFESGYTRL